MRATSRRAAMVLRASLEQGSVASSRFRTALTDVPARDRDAWVDLLWDAGGIPDDDPELPRGCVPYLPCPVATVLDAVQAAEITADDVFVDVGSGIGRTTFVVHMLTGAACIGLEIQPALVHAARERAAAWSLPRTRFVAGDAVDTIRGVTGGTVFFLYCPFGADRVQRVVDDLEIIARSRPIRICCVDLPSIERPWLTAVAPIAVDLAVYRSTQRD